MPRMLSVCIVAALAAARGDAAELLMKYQSERHTAVAPVEDDAEALGGQATHAVPKRDRPGFLFRVHDQRPVPGEYELIAWIKRGAEGAPDDIAVKLGERRQLTEVPGKNLARRGYRAVVGRWEHRAEGENIRLMVDWPGKVEVWLDKVEFRMVRAYADDELLPEDRRKAPPSRVNDGTVDVHFVRGLFSDKHYDALRAAAGDMALSTSVITPQGVRGFPGAEELSRSDVIILGDVSARAIPVEDRYRLAGWVASGGGLIILGGPYALGSGKYEGTFLEPLLPVEPQGPGDIRKLKEPRPLHGGKSPLDGLDWKALPSLRFYHHVKPRKDSEIVLSTGRIPVIVERQYEKGRVAVVCLTTQGIIEDALPWWEWSDWGKLLVREIERVSGGAS